MRNRPTIATLAALALIPIVAAACGTAPGQALPQPSSPSTSGTTTSPTAGPTVTDPAPATTQPPQPLPSSNGPPSCLGAVIYTVDASAGGRPWRTVCIAVGGLVRFQYLGPEYLDAKSWDDVDCDYEGGVHACRLIGTGTVRFTVTNSHGARPFTVVVASASNPPKPSPACMGRTETYTIDAFNGGPPWSAVCMKVGAVLRVENLGPEGFTLEPRDAVSCVYEAAVRMCRLVKPATIHITTANSQEIRPLTVVAIR
jgi:hypothetical protein